MFKASKLKLHPDTSVLVDSGFQGIQKIHAKSRLPKKNSKKNPLTKDDKKINKELSSQRIIVENVLATLKRFRVIAERYRNRRSRFTLRFNLIAGFYNFELAA